MRTSAINRALRAVRGNVPAPPTSSSRGVRLSAGAGASSKVAKPSSTFLLLTIPRGLTGGGGVFNTSRLLRQAASNQSQHPSSPQQSQSPPPSSSSSSSSPLPVSPELLAELRLIIARSPRDQWCPVSDMYAEVPPAMRRAHVRPHRTMLSVLEKVRDDLGVALTASGVYFGVGSPPMEPEVVAAAATTAGGGGGMDTGSTGVTVVTSSARSPVAPPGAPGSSGGVYGSDVPPPVDFYYDCCLSDIPAPPPDFDVTPSSLGPARGSEDGSVLALSDFTAFIPPFFVPLVEVLEAMPGYTEAHIEGHLSTSKAMEMVTINGVRYLRLYGGYAKIRLDGCGEAEAAFAQYKPQPGLIPAFTAAFAGITDQWMPLKLLLSRADPAAVAQLPFQGPAAVVYFAQMQHVFSFSVNSDSVTSSVLLRRPGFGGLECETTPTPRAFNRLLTAAPMDGSVDVQLMLSTLTEPEAAEVTAYYGDIFNFFNAHTPVFFLSDDRSAVMRTSYKRRLHVASLPLEEQLALALEQRDKGKVRTLRRRIAFRDNPSHPFHDPDNLAQEIAKYLPRKGFVTLKSFVKKSIPEEIICFMPKKMHNFFQNYPQYFQQFEFQQAGSWAVSRPGQSLPRGVIRKEFSEDDLVALTAEYLQTKGSRSCTSVFLNLPRGAQEIVRRRHGGLYYFVQKYPQLFNVVLGSDTENALSSAVVHLVQLPTRHYTSTAASSSNSKVENDDDDGATAEGGDGEDWSGED